MSLGFVTSHNIPRKTPAQSIQRPAEQRTSSHMTTFPQFKTLSCGRINLLSVKSTASVLSFISFLSFASIGGFLSTLSIFSMGSVLSVMSIGSTMSVLSIGSVDSFLSIGSNGCSLTYFGDCTAPFPEPEVTFEIDIPATSWDRMSECSFDDYQRYKKLHLENDHPLEKKCGYQTATCAFTSSTNATKNIQGVGCEVRRKGYTTWEDMGDKPSYKVKILNDKTLDMGMIDEVHMDVDKFTLNNMKYSRSWSGHREVEAYEVFRQIGFQNTPAAAHAQVTVLRGGKEINTHSYALIQDVEGTYMKTMFKARHGVDYNSDTHGYLTFEQDNRGLEFKKAKGVSGDLPEDLAMAIINKESDLLDHMDPEDLITFYMGELITHNWDGACLRHIPNNYLITATTDDGNDYKVRFIPKGMDRVFDGCGYELGNIIPELGAGPKPPYCGPMQEVLERRNDTDLYNRLKPVLEQKAKYKSRTCSEDLQTMTSMLLISCAIALLALLGGVLIAYCLQIWGVTQKLKACVSRAIAKAQEPLMQIGKR